MSFDPKTSAWLPIAMLTVSNIFMTFAWYGHLKFKGAPLMGLETDWPLTRDFSLGSEVSSTVPVSSMPWLFSGRVLGRYNLAGHRDGGLRAFGGVGYERIWFQDRSDVINDINSDSGPMLIFGIEARF